MTDKIILNIQHSDDYTDYLLMTAGLTNNRIIPMVNPSSEKLKAAKDNNTKVLRCYTVHHPMYTWSSPVTGDIDAGSITVNTGYYLEEDGSINYHKAEIVRQCLEEMGNNLLMASDNLREVFRHYFPFFWSSRAKIYQDPKLFFVDSGLYGQYISGEGMPVGAILKAMDEDPSTFQIRLGGGCSCGKKPLLIDYDHVYDAYWTLYTWCPVCQSRREIRAWNFARSYQCERAVEDAAAYYGRGKAVSPLNLFDLVDALRDSSLRSE